MTATDENGAGDRTETNATGLNVNRRDAIRATAGLVGLVTLSGLGTAREDFVAEGTTQQPLDKRIGMTATGSGTFYTVPFRWVEPGTTVVWQLVQGSHSTTAYAEANGKPHRIPEDAPGWDSGVLSESGSTFARTFNVPGVYDYYCSPHESLGMVGRLVVGTPDLDEEPALADPQDSLPDAAQDALTGLNAVTRVMFG